MNRMLQLLGSIGVAVVLVLGTALVTGAHIDTAKICAAGDSSGGHGSGH